MTLNGVMTLFMSYFTKFGSFQGLTQICRAIFAIKARIDNRKKMLSSNTSFTCPHNMVNFSLPAAEIVSLVWGTPANFNGFRILASLLQRRRSTEANQTLHNVWPLPWLIRLYIHFRRLLFGIISVTARQSSSRRQPNFAALSTGRHLYSAGRPSRWALAHILVIIYYYVIPVYTTQPVVETGCVV